MPFDWIRYDALASRPSAASKDVAVQSGKHSATTWSGTPLGVALPRDTQEHVAPRRPRFDRRSTEARQALLFLLPGVALVLLTFVYPVYRLVRLSLYQSLGSLSLYVGLDNYGLVLDDPAFRAGVRNNLLLMACVPVMVAVALFFALLLYERRRSAPLYRFVLFVPYLVSIPVSGITFSALLTQRGAVNTLLEGASLGMLSRDWLGDPSIALFSVGAVIVWRESVLGIVLFVARMLSLSPEPLEAATIDGASRWRAHWDVTLPQLRGIVGFFVVVSAITVAVWTFSYVFVMTNGGPGNATLTADLYVYQNAFATSQMNLAAAASTLILAAAVAAMALVALVGRVRRRGEPA